MSTDERLQDRQNQPRAVPNRRFSAQPDPRPRQPDTSVPGAVSTPLLKGSSPMSRRAWTRDELVIAFNLYCKLRFGQCHGRNPAVIQLAKVLDRSPNAVAMKLCNFASFDPA